VATTWQQKVTRDPRIASGRSRSDSSSSFDGKGNTFVEVDRTHHVKKTNFGTNPAGRTLIP